jgi:predicted nucleic acid-binding protein
MTSAVFDTNVVVSGLLTPDSSPGRLIDAILDGVCQPAVNDSILAEYEDVLGRPRFNFPAAKIRIFLDAIRALALHAPFAHVHGAAALPDPDDVLFISAATSLDVPIVTGHPKHFPRQWVGRIPIVSPAEFLARLTGS